MPALFHLGDLPAGHETVGTGRGGSPGSVPGRLSALISSQPSNASFGPVLGGKGADRVHDRDQHRGSIFLVISDDLMVFDSVFKFRANLFREDGSASFLRFFP